MTKSSFSMSEWEDKIYKVKCKAHTQLNSFCYMCMEQLKSFIQKLLASQREKNERK